MKGIASFHFLALYHIDNSSKVIKFRAAKRGGRNHDR